MSLGFSVAEIAPFRGARAGLRMGLVPLGEAEWRRTDYDREVRELALAAPGAVLELPQATAPAAELAALLGAKGGLREAGAAGWEDLCLLALRGNAHVLIGGAVGFPTDWRLGDKLGLPLLAVHAPIHGYAAKLASGVEQFLSGLRAGQIYGRANWFVVANDALAYLPDGSLTELFSGVTVDNASERLFVRCERQTFRRLPQTGAIVFAIGIDVVPLGSLSAELVNDLARAVAALPGGENERRAAPAYAAALSGYAAAREDGAG